MSGRLLTAGSATARTAQEAETASALRRVGRAGIIAVLPVFVGLLVAASTFGGGSFIPWQPVMVDLDVYRLAGRHLLNGVDFYRLPGSLPFLYPPFAALLAAPLALMPLALVQIAWTIAGVLALLAVLFRFGLRGWRLSLIGAVVIYFVEPASQTIAFGQLGIFLMALVALDLVPGPAILGTSRRLPQGVLTGIAAAIKLTPAIFAIYLFVTGRRRAAAVSLAVFVGISVLTAAVLPSASAGFWGRLLHGDTGLGKTIIYFTNQSLLADSVRIFGLGAIGVGSGLVLSAATAVLGIWAAARWERVGASQLAVTLCAVAGLLASPVSWSHHFVWIAPLALALLSRPLPIWFSIIGWLFIAWVAGAPFKRLPNGADLELTWTWWQDLLASVTAVLGLGLLIAAGLAARRCPAKKSRPELAVS